MKAGVTHKFSTVTNELFEGVVVQSLFFTSPTPRCFTLGIGNYAIIIPEKHCNGRAVMVT